MMVKPKHVDVWTAEEAKRFMLHVSNHRLYPLYHLALTTGMRIGELLGLRWADIDLDKQAISLAGKVEHVVPLSQQTVNVLRKHEQNQDAPVPSGLVFVSRTGGPINQRTLSKHLREATVRAGLPTLSSFYSLRHTYFSILHQRRYERA